MHICMYMYIYIYICAYAYTCFHIFIYILFYYILLYYIVLYYIKWYYIILYYIIYHIISYYIILYHIIVNCIILYTHKHRHIHMGYSHHPKATPFQLPNVPVPPPFASSDWTTSSPNVGPQRVSLAARRAELATGRSCGVFVGPSEAF